MATSRRLPATSSHARPAALASLSGPLAVAVDSSNSIYIADFFEGATAFGSRIRKITPDGIIKTIGGNGQAGLSGDNVAAISVPLGDVEDIAVDAKGNVYLAEFSSNKIRKIDGTTGIITTVAGTGQAGFSGDNGPATKATL